MMTSVRSCDDTAMCAWKHGLFMLQWYVLQHLCYELWTKCIPMWLLSNLWWTTHLLWLVGSHHCHYMDKNKVRYIYATDNQCTWPGFCFLISLFHPVHICKKIPLHHTLKGVINLIFCYVETVLLLWWSVQMLWWSVRLLWWSFLSTVRIYDDILSW